MGITSSLVIGLLGLLEFVGLEDVELHKHNKPNKLNKPY